MEKMIMEQLINMSKQIGELGARMEDGFKRQEEKMEAMEKRLCARMDTKIAESEERVCARMDMKIAETEERLGTRITETEENSEQTKIELNSENTTEE